MQALPTHHQLRRDRGVCVRIATVTTVLLAAFSVITHRLATLQIRRHDELSQKAAERYQDVRFLPAQRGSIRDRSGEYLVFDEKSWELRTDRQHLNDRELLSRHLAKARGLSQSKLRQDLPGDSLIGEYHQHVAETLAQPLGMTEEELLAHLQAQRSVTVLKKELEPKEAEAFRGLISSHHIIGVTVHETMARRHASLDRLTLVLGATRDAEGGIWGVEKLCDDVLRGVPGKRFIEKDRYGNEMPLFRGATLPSKNGSDVFLTIDMNLQDTIEALVDQAFKEHEPKSIVAILTEPATGSILAMTCRPHLELAEKQANWRNIPVSDAYEPGSVMKIVAMAGALDAGLVSPSSTIDCGYGRYGSPELAGRDITDEKKNLGVQPLSSVLVYSSNIGTYKLARMLGWERMDRTLRQFGFGTPTGLGICQEPAGHWKSVDRMTAVDFSRNSFGYGITATALQQIMAYGTIANGGVLMKPRIIDRIVHEGGTRLEFCHPEPVRQACTARTAAQVHQMLEKVITDGTGKRAQIEGVRVAGKTGTRRVFDPVRKTYREDQHVVSFIGFAPADNPRLACLIMLDNPKKHDEQAIGGGATAAPIFAQLMRAGLDHLEVRIERAKGVLAQSANSSTGGAR